MARIVSHAESGLKPVYFPYAPIDAMKKALELQIDRALILTTLLYAMKDKKARYGLATLCIGGGEAVAMVVERQ